MATMTELKERAERVNVILDRVGAEALQMMCRPSGAFVGDVTPVNARRGDTIRSRYRSLLTESMRLASAIAKKAGAWS